MARISLLFCLVTLIAFSFIINEASARQVSFSFSNEASTKFHAKSLTMPGIKKVPGAKEDFLKMIEKVKAARVTLKYIKAKEENVKGLKSELKFLSKSEALLKAMMKSLESGAVSEKKLSIFLKQLSRFYKAWRVVSSNQVVPEKEREYMVKIGEIVKCYKEYSKKVNHKH